MARIALEANGSVEAVTRLMKLADERGFAVHVDNPATVETGSGRIELEPPIIDEQPLAHAAVQALIEQVPGGPAAFTIV